MIYDLILSGGTIVTTNGLRRADIGVLGGRIYTLAQDLSDASAERVLKVENKYILPGCIDSHMHLWEPGLVADPDFRAGTIAAAESTDPAPAAAKKTHTKRKTVRHERPSREFWNPMNFFAWGSANGARRAF